MEGPGEVWQQWTYQGAKSDMFEGVSMSLVSLNMPGVFEGGRRDNHFVVMMDLMPTICDFVNVPMSGMR